MREHAPMDVFSGGATVISSGTIIPFTDRGLVTFQIGPLTERLSITFKFEDGPNTGPESRIQVLRPDVQKIQLVLRNFGTSTGEGTVQPLKLGALEGLSLYVHFRIFRVGTAPRTLHYTFFQRDDKAFHDRLADALLTATPGDE